MKVLTVYLRALLSACLLGLLTFHPLPSAAQQTGKLPNPWLIRSRTITDEILADTNALSAFDRAITWAQLGAAWWKDDPALAKAWMLKAVESVEAVPSRETAVEYQDRMATARTLLSLIALRDEQMGKRLEAVFTSEAEQATTVERNSNADALLESALALLDSNAKRAAELGSAALRVGKPARLIVLLWGLRERDDKLADALLADAIAAARKTLDLDLLVSLKRVAFPELEYPKPTQAAPPDTLRTQLLLAFSEYLERTLKPSEGQANACSSAALAISVVVPLLPELKRLTPEQFGAVRQLILPCQTAPGSFTDQRVNRSLTEKSTRTVNDWLKAAEEATDLNVKTVYQMRAAQLAAGNKDYQRALSILESMEQEARAFANGAWEGFRWEWAAQLTADYFKRDNLAGMRQVIAAVPSGLRPFAQVALAGAALSNKNRQIMIEMLDEARKGLSQSDEADSEKVTWYMSLVRLYAKAQSSERALSAFEEAVKALNRSDVPERQAKESGGFFERVASSPLTSSDFPASLLEAEDYAVRKNVFAIVSPSSRAQARIGLLKLSIEESRKQTAPPKSKVVAARGGRDENQ